MGILSNLFWFKKRTIKQYNSFDLDNNYEEAIDRYYNLMVNMSLSSSQKDILSVLHREIVNKNNFTHIDIYKALFSKYSLENIKSDIFYFLSVNIIAKLKKGNPVSLYYRHYKLL